MGNRVVEGGVRRFRVVWGGQSEGKRGGSTCSWWLQAEIQEEGTGISHVPVLSLLLLSVLPQPIPEGSSEAQARPPHERKHGWGSAVVETYVSNPDGVASRLWIEYLHPGVWKPSAVHEDVL